MPLSKIDKAEKALGIKFSDKYFLKLALTHRSFPALPEEPPPETNEKLEFLGDAILSLIITDFIFHRFPQLNEGELAKLRANLVNSEILAQISSEMGLGEFILLGKGTELIGGREKTSILGDCLEAIIGAIYIDQGLEEAKKFVLNNFKNVILEQSQQKDFSDFKTALQERVVEKMGITPEYKVIKEEGAVHDKTFYVEVFIEGESYGKGKGKSKKKAEQKAAQEALKKLKNETEEKEEGGA